MPTYEYRCAKCGVFEHRQSFNDPALERCPTCGGKVQKLISSVGVIYRAGGFYVSDNRPSDYRQKSNQDSGNSTKSAAE